MVSSKRPCTVSRLCPESGGIVIQIAAELAVGRLPVEVAGEVQASPHPGPVAQPPLPKIVVRFTAFVSNTDLLT